MVLCVAGGRAATSPVRALSAAAPWVVGIIAARGGLGSAFGISGLGFLLAGVPARGLPETHGRTLA